MKKILCILLVIAAVLSMCACGKQETKKSSKRETDGEPVEITIPVMVTDPTQEEYETLYEYSEIMIALEYADTQELLFDYYTRLLELEEIDKFYGTEYVTAAYWAEHDYYCFSDVDSINWNRKEVLAQFNVVEDQLLKVMSMKTDHMGNNDYEYSLFEYTYHADGRIAGCDYPEYERKIVEQWRDCGTNLYEYDAQGRLSTVTFRNGDYADAPIYSVYTYYYDANGYLTERTRKTNSGTTSMAYTCNDKGQVEKISWEEDYSQWEILYTYDQQGNMVQEEKIKYNSDGNVIDYYVMKHTYEGNRLVGSEYTDLDYESLFAYYLYCEQSNVFTYEYDDQGRMVKAVETYGNQIRYNGSGNVISEDIPRDAYRTYTFVYGDYLTFDRV